MTNDAIYPSFKTWSQGLKRKFFFKSPSRLSLYVLVGKNFFHLLFNNFSVDPFCHETWNYIFLLEWKYLVENIWAISVNNISVSSLSQLQISVWGNLFIFLQGLLMLHYFFSFDAHSRLRRYEKKCEIYKRNRIWHSIYIW